MATNADAMIKADMGANRSTSHGRYAAHSPTPAHRQQALLEQKAIDVEPLLGWTEAVVRHK